MNFKTKFKENKGITLIALVVTIVVLLILVGASINALVGNNGIITQTERALIESNHSNVLEMMGLEITTYSIDNAIENSAFDVLTLLQEEGKIDENNVVNVKNLVNQELSTGNGTGKSDVYIIEKNDNNEYELVYYDKEQTPRKLGSLMQSDEKDKSADLEIFGITEEGVVSINADYYGEGGGGCWIETGKIWNDNWTMKELTIPSVINGIEVKKIEDGFLTDNKIIEKVNIPKGVTEIGVSAFNGCSNLTSIIIPDNVTSIGDGAFDSCSSLTTITIPNSVTSMGNGAFYGCSSLTTITIPNSVTSIGGWAFKSCSSLTTITIPNSVTSIEDEAFEYCSRLTTITIPNSVTSIGFGAFDSCSSLTTITIPNSVTSIRNWTFDSCSSLTTITIPDNVTSIGTGAFYGCSSLTTVNYKGTKAQWDEISIDNENECLTKITPNYNYK